MRLLNDMNGQTYEYLLDIRNHQNDKPSKKRNHQKGGFVKKAQSSPSLKSSIHIQKGDNFDCHPANHSYIWL